MFTKKCFPIFQTWKYEQILFLVFCWARIRRWCTLIKVKSPFLSIDPIFIESSASTALKYLFGRYWLHGRRVVYCNVVESFVFVCIKSGIVRVKAGSDLSGRSGVPGPAASWICISPATDLIQANGCLPVVVRWLWSPSRARIWHRLSRWLRYICDHHKFRISLFYRNWNIIQGSKREPCHIKYACRFRTKRITPTFP